MSVLWCSWAESHPDRLQQVLSARPIVWIPLGTYEHHGWHLPVCFDGLKAQAICQRAARRVGGAVLPPLYYGHGGGHIGYRFTWMVSPESIRAILDPTLDRLADHQVKVVVLWTGHYPQEQLDLVRQAAEDAQRRHPGMRCLALSEPLLQTPEPGDVFPGDHAAKYETSLALALKPSWVRMDALREGRTRQHHCTHDSPAGADAAHDPAHPLFAICGQDPRQHASAALGRKLLRELLNRSSALVRQALQEAV